MGHSWDRVNKNKGSKKNQCCGGSSFIFSLQNTSANMPCKQLSISPSSPTPISPPLPNHIHVVTHTHHMIAQPGKHLPIHEQPQLHAVTWSYFMEQRGTKLPWGKRLAPGARGGGRGKDGNEGDVRLQKMYDAQLRMQEVLKINGIVRIVLVANQMRPRRKYKKATVKEMQGILPGSNASYKIETSPLNLSVPMKVKNTRRSSISLFGNDLLNNIDSAAVAMTIQASYEEKETHSVDGDEKELGLAKPGGDAEKRE